jgi:hypothetical protein
MSSGSPLEWKEMDNFLKTLCSTIGLQINWSKSNFHHADMHEQDLDLLKGIFPHSFIHLSKNFQYLGYFIKVDHYKSSDWVWLVSKVTNKLGHWCNKWLSMGGLYTLIKATLEGHLIYWMALATIPPSVLDKNFKLTYNFLWNDHKEP